MEHQDRKAFLKLSYACLVLKRSYATPWVGVECRLCAKYWGMKLRGNSLSPVTVVPFWHMGRLEKRKKLKLQSWSESRNLRIELSHFSELSLQYLRAGQLREPCRPSAVGSSQEGRPRGARCPLRKSAKSRQVKRCFWHIQPMMYVSQETSAGPWLRGTCISVPWILFPP